MGATAFMLIFIIPTFAKMFTDFGGELPLPTQIVLDDLELPARRSGGPDRRRSSAAWSRIQRYYTTEIGQRNIDRLLLKMPVIGDVLLKGAVARFTRTLGTLISSGVPILSGLEITAQTAGNQVIAEAIMSRRGPRSARARPSPRRCKAVRRVPAHGGADDLGRRADRRPGRDAHQDRRLLRRRGRHGGRHPDRRSSSRS